MGLKRPRPIPNVQPEIPVTKAARPGSSIPSSLKKRGKKGNVKVKERTVTDCTSHMMARFRRHEEAPAAAMFT